MLWSRLHMLSNETQIPLVGTQTTRLPNTPLRFLWYVTKPHKWYLFAAAIAVTLAELASTSIPYIFRSVIDTAQNVVAGTTSVNHVWVWAAIYPIAVALVFFSWRTSGFLGMEWATRANATAYNTLFSYLSRHSHSYFSDRFAGSLSSKVSHASEGTQSLSEAFLWNYYPTIISLIFTIGYISTSSTLAALLFIGLIVVLVPLNVYLARYRRPHVVEYSEQATKARGYAVDAITNMAAIRQFARMKDEEKRFGEQITKMRSLNVRQWRISEWSLVTNNVIIVLFEALILLVSINLWIAGNMTIGELVMITTLMMNVQGTLVFIGSSMNGFIRRFGEIQEGLNDILVEHEIVDGPTAKQLEARGGKIEWKHVAFSYGDQQVFNGFDLNIEPGERIGLVGSSGAGKSTFVSLLLRQHELQGGEISIDGQNIAAVTQDSLRENITIVPQEPMLFHRTIKENIAYGNTHAHDEEIIAAAKKAQAHDFICALNDGYNTIVGERGVKLSGGQRQRVAIARAILKNSPILVLDEATSALDSESEVAIQQALHELMNGKTVIAIAHRLSTLREMDRIIVLDHGRIIEDGTHASLTQAGGLYSRLWQHQAGGFLQD